MLGLLRHCWMVRCERYWEGVNNWYLASGHGVFELFTIVGS